MDLDPRFLIQTTFLFKGTVNIILSDPLIKEGNVRLTTLSLKPLCVYCIICVCKLPKSWQSAEAVYTVQCTLYSLNSIQRSAHRHFQPATSDWVHLFMYTTNTQRFQGDHFKFDFPLFAWRVTWNFADSPFKIRLFQITSFKLQVYKVNAVWITWLQRRIQGGYWG